MVAVYVKTCQSLEGRQDFVRLYTQNLSMMGKHLLRLTIAVTFFQLDESDDPYFFLYFQWKYILLNNIFNIIYSPSLHFIFQIWT